MIRSNLQRIARCAALLAALATNAAANEALLDRVVELHLPAQPLAESLVAMAEQARVQIVTASDAVRDLSAPAIQGTMPLGDAMTRILEGTGLSFRVAGANTIGIRLQQPGSGATDEELEAVLAAVPGVPDDSVPVTAGAPSAVQPGAEHEQRTRGIEEIIVTATKRKVSVRDIAGSVTALTGEAIEDGGIQDIDDIADAVPGVNLSKDDTGGTHEPNRVTIRGISAGLSQNDTVGIFIDETPFTDVFFSLVTADANPFDMSSVEILKGPVGTLFGGSALNGAIRYIPQKPVFDEWQTRAFSEFGTNNESDDVGRIFGVALNVPLWDDLALRVVGSDRRSAGYTDSLNQSYQAKDVNKIRQQMLRAILRWRPLDPLDLSLMVVDQDTLVADIGYADADRGGRYERTANPQPTPRQSTYQTWQLKAAWNFDWAELVLVGSTSDKKFDGIADASFLAESDPESTTVFSELESQGRPRSQELRIVSAPGDAWDWLAGVYNYTYAVTARDDTFAGGEGSDTAVPAALVADVSERAAFGEVNWRFLSQFELTGGVRLYEFSYLGEFSGEGPACVTVDPTCPATGFRGAFELDKTERSANPKLSLKWSLNDEVMTYASASRGFRFGGLNLNAGTHPGEIPPVYGSDSLWSYETGVRAQWLNGSLVTDLAGFLIDWGNAQLSRPTSDGAGVYTDNVGAVEGRGLESQVIWRPPVEGVSLTLIGAYAKIQTAQDFTPESSTGTNPTTPAGTPWPRAPTWQTGAALGWSRQLQTHRLSASLTHSYFGKARQNFFNAPPIFGYSTYDFQIKLKNAGDSWWPDAVLNVNNLTNKQATTFRIDSPSPGGGRPRVYTAPRSVSLRLSCEF